MEDSTPVPGEAALLAMMKSALQNSELRSMLYATCNPVDGPSPLSTSSPDRFSLLPPGTPPTAANFNQRCPSYMTGVSPVIPALPEGVYETFEAADKFLRRWALTKGFKLVILNSRGNSAQVNYACWLRTKRKHKESASVSDVGDDAMPLSSSDGAVVPPIVKPKRKRDTLSKDKGCPYRVKVTRESQGRWRVRVSGSAHNHGATIDITALAPPFTDEQKRKIHTGAAKGLSLAIVHESIGTAEFPSCYFTSDRVYAEMHRYKTHLAGNFETSMKNLLASLLHKDSPWYISARYTRARELQALFMMHTDAHLIVQKYWRTITIDCTYCTNIHGLKLLNMVGRAPTGQTYTLAHCFLDGETKASFVWALECLRMLLPEGKNPTFFVDKDHAVINALGIVFPDSRKLLCVWHLSKAAHAKIEQKVRPDNEDSNEDDPEVIEQLALAKDELSQLIKELIHAKSFEEEQATWNDLLEMHDLYPGRRDFIRYFQDVWWPWRRMWVEYRNNDVMHFGRSTTGAVESAHGRLKKALPGRNNTLLFLKSVLELLAVREHKEISKKITRQGLGRPSRSTRTELERQFLDPLQNKVAWKALAIAQFEIQRGVRIYESDLPRTTCECLAKHVHGVPCRHVFADLLAKGDPILEATAFDISQRLPQKWPTGPPIRECERTFDVSGNQTVDFMKDLEDMIKGQDRVDRTALLGQLHDIAKELLARQITTPVNARPSATEAAFRQQHQKATKRLPSMHEHVDRSAKRRPCGRCRKTGHLISRCPAPAPAEKPQKKCPSGKRRCRSCNKEGHTRASQRCENYASNQIAAEQSDDDETALDALAEAGAQHYTQHRRILQDMVDSGLMPCVQEEREQEEALGDEFDDEELDVMLSNDMSTGV